MVIAGLSQSDFIALLKENGCEVVSNKYWDLEGVERIVLAKDGQTFVLRLKKYFFYPEVIKKFKMWEFTKVPDICKEAFADCEKAHEQEQGLRKRMEAAKEAKNSQTADKGKDDGKPTE